MLGHMGDAKKCRYVHRASVCSDPVKWMAQQHSPNKAECRHAAGFEKVLVTAVAEDEDA